MARSLRDILNRVKKPHSPDPTQTPTVSTYLSSLYDVACTMDLDGMITSVNQAFERMVGLPSLDIIRTPWTQWVLPDHMDMSREHFIATTHGQAQTFKATVVCPARTIDVNFLTIPLFAGETVIGVYAVASADRNAGDSSSFKDATLQRERQRFCIEIQRAAVLGVPLGHLTAVINLRVRRFDEYVTRLGYETAGQIITCLHERIREQLGPQDQMIRMLYDDFHILLTGLQDETQLDERLSVLLDSLARPVSSGDDAFHVSVSAGVAATAALVPEPEQIMQNARIACHTASERTLSAQKYEPEMHEEFAKTFALRHDLERAILQNEFTMHYQPRIHLGTGRVVGAEALIRWRHPELGLISPSVFIPLAEQTHTMVPLGKWVLHTVAQQVRQWRTQGFDLRVSVNLSPVQVLEDDFVSTFQEIVETYELPPSALELEVTETAYVENEERFRATMGELHRLGAHIALDDFGSGYSTFKALHTYQVDTLKIDQSFVQGVLDDPYSQQIVSTMISLGHSWNLLVVAEGVETEAQVRRLGELQCDEVQGYLFNRPVPPEQFVTCLTPAAAAATSEETKEEDPFVNRREFYRIELPIVLEADFWIREVRGQCVSSNSTLVSIRNIGPGGLRFETDLQIDINASPLIKIETRILGHPVVLYGRLVWSRETSKGQFEYGVQLEIDENGRTQLTSTLNRLSALLRRGSQLPETRLRAHG